MKERAVNHSTFVIERTYPAAPNRVFAAFADPAKKRRWFLESGGHTIEHFEMDFRAGGRELARVVFKDGTPVAGMTCISDSTYDVIVPGSHIVYTNTMTIGGNCISSVLVTLEMQPVDTGTILIVTHQAAFFQGADGPEMREGGWQKLMDRLSTELAQADVALQA
jgi:uncharacterized protein YndB with AHSA1/START domain